MTASSDTADRRVSDRLAEIISLLVSTTSLVAVALLCVDLFDPLRSLAGGAFLSSTIFFLRPFSASNPPKLSNRRELALITSLLALAFFFRSDPYLWIGGGQDQGVYVSMASHLGAEGSPFFYDELRSSLSDELKIKYDANNVVMQTNRVNYEQGKREGVYLPGMYVADLAESRYVFQFYPVHPIWMATFEMLFGESRKVFSVPFFGLLSIFFFYLILRQLTDHAVFSFFGASLLSLNPLHAFFSKFPVAEVPHLAFSLGGLFFLLRGLAPQVGARMQSYLLFLSALSFSAMFFTRINGFMFLPTLIFGMLFNEVFSEERSRQAIIRAYLLALAVSYLLSVSYGLSHSFPYTSDIFHFLIQPTVAKAWPYVALVTIGVTILTIAMGFSRDKSVGSHLRVGMARLLDFGLLMGPLVVLCTIILSSYLAYQLAFTDNFSETRYGAKWGVAGLGWEALRHWSLAVFFSHLSPGVALFFLIYLRGLWRNAVVSTKIIGLSTAGFFMYIALIKWFVPYQYYFARYQLSELLPLALLVSLLLFWQVLHGSFGWVRKGLACLLMISSVPYSMAITSGQLGLQEQKGLLGTVKSIEDKAGLGSVVLINARRLDLPDAGEVRTALTFHSSLQVVSVDAETEFSFLEHFCDQALPISRLDTAPIENAVRVTVAAPLYQRRSNTLLAPQNNPSSVLYLQRVDCEQERLKRVVKTGYLYEERKATLGTVSGFHPNSDWTQGTAIFAFTRPVPTGDRIVIETFGWAPMKQKSRADFLAAKANQHSLECELIDIQHFECDTSDLYQIDRLQLTFQTWRPVDFEMNDDTNLYGLPIKSIQIR